MFRTNHALAVLVIASYGYASSGCSSDTPATPRVTFTADVTKGTHSGADCPESGTWFEIGSFGNTATGEKVAPIDDGGEFEGQKVSATCSVKAVNDGFDVNASTTLSGAKGGSFTVTGFFRPQGDQNDITMTLTRAGASYTGRKCVVKYSQPLQTAAAGRVWGSFDCADVSYASAQRTCSATGQFRFENCAQ